VETLALAGFLWRTLRDRRRFDARLRHLKQLLHGVLKPRCDAPDGKRVLISILSTGDLLVYDVASRKEVHRLSLGKGCAGILMDPDGSRVFVGCTAANYVAGGPEDP
jgi:hypothetical protein